MKAICINDKWRDGRKINKGSRVPTFGEEVEIIDTITATTDMFGKSIIPGTYYKLSGFEPTAGFISTHFSPISDIDETEMIREYQTEKA